MTLMYNGIPIELPGSSGPDVEESSLVRGMTKEEFDALSEGDKKGLIVVTDEESSAGGSSSSSNTDIYSTEEQVIGKWIDGKTLYSKTFLFTTPDEATIVAASTVLTYEGIETVVDISGTLLTKSNRCVPIPSHYDDAEKVYAAFNPAVHTTLPNVLRFSAGIKYANRPCRITMKYTKVSDNANTLKMRPINSLASATFEKREG